MLRQAGRGIRQGQAGAVLDTSERRSREVLRQTGRGRGRGAPQASNGLEERRVGRQPDLQARARASTNDGDFPWENAQINEVTDVKNVLLTAT